MNKIALGLVGAAMGGAVLLGSAPARAQNGRPLVIGKIPTVQSPAPTLEQLAAQLSALQKRCDELSKENGELKTRLDKLDVPVRLVIQGHELAITNQSKALAQLRQDFDKHTHVQAGYAPSGAIRLSGVGGTGEAVFFIGGFGDKNQSTGAPKYPGSK